ncbi:hypothetical protein [Mycetohabitans rhizoxinica]|uniref:Sigma-70 family RNA polymerase sigma factor n=1 Tax=Mycetohabitans rhizoxinica TaxID=412963 RepID=A0ABZ2Q2Y4_9BURK
MNKQEQHTLCMEWAAWHRTRKLYAPPPPRNVLALLREPAGKEVPDAIADRALMLLHRVISFYPDGKEKTAFYLYYLYGARPVKRVASEMGLSRMGFYKALHRAREDICAIFSRAHLFDESSKCKPKWFTK